MSKTASPALSIVVPAFNEQHRIVATLDRITEFLDQHGDRYELIVVDDGSRDDTRAVAERFAREHAATRVLAMSENVGKGGAVRAGILDSRGELVLFSDADLSTPIEELAKLRAAIAGGADIAIGSRAAGTAVVQPLFRRIQGRVFHLVARALGFSAVGAIADTQCGFKLFRGAVARALFRTLSIDGFAFDVELLELAYGRFQIAEVPVAWTHVAGSKVRPGLDAIAMVRELVRIRASWSRAGRPLLALQEGEAR